MNRKRARYIVETDGHARLFKRDGEAREYGIIALIAEGLSVFIHGDLRNFASKVAADITP